MRPKEYLESLLSIPGDLPMRQLMQRVGVAINEPNMRKVNKFMLWFFRNHEHVKTVLDRQSQDKSMSEDPTGELAVRHIYSCCYRHI